MTKLGQWPLWLQLLVGLPHAALLLASVWLWWPKSGKGWLRFVCAIAYLWMFYLVFVR